MATTVLRRSARDIYKEQIVALKNKLNDLRGEALVGEEYLDQFEGYKLYELKAQMESLQKAVEAFNLKEEAEKYFAGEGKELFEKATARKEQMETIFNDSKKCVEEIARKLEEKTGMTARTHEICYDAVRIDLCFMDDEKKMVFGSEIEVRYDKDCLDFKNEKEGKLEVSVGSMGFFDALDEDQFSRARYFIILGQLLADTEMLKELAANCEALVNTVRNARKVYWMCERFLENPFKNIYREEMPNED